MSDTQTFSENAISTLNEAKGGTYHADAFAGLVRTIRNNLPSGYEDTETHLDNGLAALENTTHFDGYSPEQKTALITYLAETCLSVIPHMTFETDAATTTVTTQPSPEPPDYSVTATPAQAPAAATTSAIQPSAGTEIDLDAVRAGTQTVTNQKLANFLRGIEGKITDPALQGHLRNSALLLEQQPNQNASVNSDYLPSILATAQQAVALLPETPPAPVTPAVKETIAPQTTTPPAPVVAPPTEEDTPPQPDQSPATDSEVTLAFSKLKLFFDQEIDQFKEDTPATKEFTDAHQALQNGEVPQTPEELLKYINIALDNFTLLKDNRQNPAHLSTVFPIFLETVDDRVDSDSEIQATKNKIKQIKHQIEERIAESNAQVQKDLQQEAEAEEKEEQQQTRSIEIEGIISAAHAETESTNRLTDIKVTANILATIAKAPERQHESWYQNPDEAGTDANKLYALAAHTPDGQSTLHDISLLPDTDLVVRNLQNYEDSPLPDVINAMGEGFRELSTFYNSDMTIVPGAQNNIAARLGALSGRWNFSNTTNAEGLSLAPLVKSTLDRLDPTKIAQELQGAGDIKLPENADSMISKEKDTSGSIVNPRVHVGGHVSEDLEDVSAVAKVGFSMNENNFSNLLDLINGSEGEGDNADAVRREEIAHVLAGHLVKIDRAIVLSDLTDVEKAFNRQTLQAFADKAEILPLYLQHSLIQQKNDIELAKLEEQIKGLEEQMSKGEETTWGTGGMMKLPNGNLRPGASGYENIRVEHTKFLEERNILAQQILKYNQELEPLVKELNAHIPLSPDLAMLRGILPPQIKEVFDFMYKNVAEGSAIHGYTIAKDENGTPQFTSETLNQMAEDMLVKMPVNAVTGFSTVLNSPLLLNGIEVVLQDVQTQLETLPAGADRDALVQSVRTYLGDIQDFTNTVDSNQEHRERINNLYSDIRKSLNSPGQQTAITEPSHPESPDLREQVEHEIREIAGMLSNKIWDDAKQKANDLDPDNNENIRNTLTPGETEFIKSVAAGNYEQANHFLEKFFSTTDLPQPSPEDQPAYTLTPQSPAPPATLPR